MSIVIRQAMRSASYCFPIFHSDHSLLTSLRRPRRLRGSVKYFPNSLCKIHHEFSREWGVLRYVSTLKISVVFDKEISRTCRGCDMAFSTNMTKFTLKN